MSLMEKKIGGICLREESDGETHHSDSSEDDVTVPVLKLQPRSVSLEGRWNNEMRMAEIIPKGSIWRTTGINRCGKIYFSIEEVLFLAELGAFLLMDEDGVHLSMEDIYAKISDESNGCSLEHFQAYRQLKSLGYIVARHGIPWSLKNVKKNGEASFPKGSLENLVELKSEDVTSVTAMFGRMQIDEVRPIFDVYSPNSKFRKSSPGDPIFMLCFASGSPPSESTLEVLEKHCQGVPLKFCHVEQGRVSFFSFDRVELPVLP